MLRPRPTTCIESIALSSALGLDVTVFSETFQFTGSFKFRAAINVAQKIPNRSLIAASSGNFGQAIAFACKLTGIRCTVVMPDNSARVKIDAVRSFGAVVELIDTSRVTRETRVRELALLDPDAYLASAYDDPLVIEGNATLGLEIAAINASRTTPFDAIFVPVGGGGLASGILKGLRENEDRTPVYGVEPLLANDFAMSIEQGTRVIHEREAQTIADGARTRSVGQHNWEILRHQIAGVFTVSEEAIRDAMRLLFFNAHLKVEPTGALTMAALLEHGRTFKHVAGIASGGNVDPETFFEMVKTHRDA